MYEILLCLDSYTNLKCWRVNSVFLFLIFSQWIIRFRLIVTRQKGSIFYEEHNGVTSQVILASEVVQKMHFAFY